MWLCDEERTSGGQEAALSPPGGAFCFSAFNSRVLAPPMLEQKWRPGPDGSAENWPVGAHALPGYT